MEMPFISTTSYFDLALDYLEWCDYPFSKYFSSDIRNLILEVGLLKTFDLYMRNCRRRNHGMVLEHGQEEKANTKSDRVRRSIILFTIQDLVTRIQHDLDSAYLRDMQSGASDFSGIEGELIGFREDIELLFEKDINESWTNILLGHYSLGDARLVTDFIDSLSENLEYLLFRDHEFGEAFHCLIHTLKEKLMFLKSFICFVILQGVQGEQLIDLLIHIEVVAIKAARLIFISWFERDDEEVCNEMQFEISQLLREKIDPVDPQVQETYIHVLTASKLSRSSHNLALEENQNLVAKFIVCLLDYIMDLISHNSFLVPVKDQMLKFHQGVGFLSILLSQQQERFNELHDELKDLIRIVVCDAGIMTFSLSVNEIEIGLAKETDLELFHLLKVLEVIKGEVTQIYPVKSPSSYRFPRTNELGSIDFLLENLVELACSEHDLVTLPKDQILTVQEDLIFLRSFLQNILEQRNQNEKLRDVWNHVMEVAYKAELVIDSVVVGDKPECLDTIAGDIKLVKTEALEIYDSMRHDIEAQRVTKNFICIKSQHNTLGLNDVLVGLDDEVKTMMDKITRGSKLLDIVSIVGMPGLGKTAVASKVFSDPLVLGHFHICAWCTVSQVYSKHNLLVQILGCIASGRFDQYLNMNEDDLAEKLYKCLKGNRYLIILDDVWDIEPWNLLKPSLPDDANGSRILFTSRFHNLSSQFKEDCTPHHLRQLTDEESWALLQTKIFGKEVCPPALRVVGKQIAKNCKGLPLTVILVAGILSNVEEDCWEEVANSLSSRSVIETEHCMKTLELSYNHLPDYLKPCLLYLGAFQEDQDIPVRKLKLLWISEGFVRKTEPSDLEDVADGYLTDLITRSLVMVTLQRSVGGIKACRIHDLVHEFCVEKAKEERFLQILPGHTELSTYNGSYSTDRFFIYSATEEELKNSRLLFPNLRSLIWFSNHDWEFVLYGVYSFRFKMFKLLRVLDLGKLCLGSYFPREVVLLVHLRYLTIQCYINSIPSSLANLSRLETFIIKVYDGNVGLPDTIRSMKKLRHLYVEGILSPVAFSLSSDDLEVFQDIYHFETFTLAVDPSPQIFQKILTKLPSIRRLKCVGGRRYSAESFDGIIKLDFLSQLESLKVVSFQRVEFAFPLNLRKLTLSILNGPGLLARFEQNKLRWNKISAIAELPNLEVLKLSGAFVGETWEMGEGAFPKLRFLKLAYLDIVRWTASCDDFPPLQKLVLEGCSKLEEVPSCLGDIPTIEVIEVKWCHKSTASLVKQIQEQQMDMGNECLKIFIQENFKI